MEHETQKESKGTGSSNSSGTVEAVEIAGRDSVVEGEETKSPGDFADEFLGDFVDKSPEDFAEQCPEVFAETEVALLTDRTRCVKELKGYLTMIVLVWALKDNAPSAAESY